MIELLAAALAVVVGSALCSGTEAALFSLPLSRARQLVHDRPQSKRAATVLRIREDMSRPIGTIVILNNIANIGGAILVGSLATRVLGSEWLGAVSGLLTFVVIVAGEIIPKTVGERYAEPIALAVARPLLLLSAVFAPLVLLVHWVTLPLVRGTPSTTTNEAEIRLLAHIGQLEGSIEADESEMIQRVFSLNDHSAADLMTPRVNVSALWADDTLAEVAEVVRQCPHTRMVIYGEDVDDVLGFAMKADLLAGLLDDRGEEPLSAFARPVQRVPEGARADRLLEVFRRSRQHLAVVINEYGGNSGVITLEDVLEVITGEIVDETDTVVDLQEHARQRRRELLQHAELLDDDPPEIADADSPEPTSNDPAAADPATPPADEDPGPR